MIEAVQNGMSLSVIHDTDPRFFLLNKRKVEEYKTFYMQRLRVEALLPKPSCDDLANVADFVPTSASVLTAGCTALALWLKENLYGHRAFKQKQLYIHGGPNLGKSSLTRTLAKFMSVYWAPMEENFFDAFDDEVHTLVVFDEFKAQHPLTFMNAFLQGGEMCLRRKGSQFIKTQNLPVIILSNYSPREAYSRVSDVALEAFLSRVLVVELLEPVFFLIEYIEELLDSQ